MVSKKHHKRRSSSSSRSKNCKGGRKSSKRARTEKKRKTHKWHQKGCQSGGSSVAGGGSAWQASNVQHQSGGSSSAPNGNHYALNTAISAPAQSSNHLVEKGMFGGRHSRRRHGHKGNKHGRKHRRFIGEQHGGMAQYLPEIANAEVRGITEVPSGMVNALQGASTAFKTSNPTVQPIGQPLQL
jgi:hypothetical protein